MYVISISKSFRSDTGQTKTGDCACETATSSQYDSDPSTQPSVSTTSTFSAKFESSKPAVPAVTGTALVLYPFQPPSTYKFPTKKFASDQYKRFCKSIWFAKWPWLHYVPETDSVWCFNCLEAVNKKLVTLSNRQAVFVDSGFSNCFAPNI